MDIKVSIIVPAYRENELILDCLHSVEKQTYEGPLECIIVDDCGNDNTMAFVDSFIKSYKGTIVFRVVHHSVNKGLSAARNTGIEESKGDFVFFLDSDDTIKSYCVEKMVDCIDEHPDVDVVFAGADVVGRDWQFMDMTKKNLPGYSNNPLWIKATMLERFTLSMTAWNRMVRRSLIIKEKLLFADGLIHEDELWNFELSKKLSSVAILHENTYVYYYRERGITATESYSSKLKVMIPIWRRMINCIDDVLPDAQVKSICRQILEWPMWRIPIKERMTLKGLLLKTCRYVSLDDQVAILCYAVLGSVVYHIPMVNRYIRGRFQYINLFGCVE